MEPEERAHGEPDATKAHGQIVDPADDEHTYVPGDRVRLNHDYTFGDRFYAAGAAGEIIEIDVTTYGATEGIMETLGARIRFDGDASEAAGWAPYTLLERETPP
jgi:hypothetical protein